MSGLIKNWIALVLICFLGVNAIAQLDADVNINVTLEGNNNDKPDKDKTPDAEEEEEEEKKPLVLDGAFKKIGTKENEILRYDHIRESDVLWSKRIWRVIDVREKMNLPFTYPKQYLIDIFLDVVKKNDVAVYTTEDFTTALNRSEVQKKLGSTDSISVIDPDTYEEVIQVVQNKFNPETVAKFRLKEDWFFDEETSTLRVRLLGIAPIEDVLDDNGNLRGERAMFWIYYPDFREYLAKYEVFNPFNDAQRLTWEDLFEMRFFSSYIVKESNVRDMRIQDYASGIDALLESERIKSDIFDYEHDLWSY